MTETNLMDFLVQNKMVILLSLSLFFMILYVSDLHLVGWSNNAQDLRHIFQPES